MFGTPTSSAYTARKPSNERVGDMMRF